MSTNGSSAQPEETHGPDMVAAGLLGATVPFVISVILLVVHWLTDLDIGGPGLLLVSAPIAYIIGRRLAIQAHQRNHFTKVMSGTMKPREVTAGVEVVSGLWAVSIDNRAPIAVAPYDSHDGQVIVDGANICMAAPNSLRRMPNLDSNRWRPIARATVATTGEALQLMADALKADRANPLNN